MYWFDLATLTALLIVALSFRTKASVYLLTEKLICFLLIGMIIESVNFMSFHLIFSYLGFVFVYIIHRHLPDRNLLKLTATLLAMLHAFVVVAYYLLPYQSYLTVYNIYPKLYLVIVALQTVGVTDGGCRLKFIIGPVCLSIINFVGSVFYRASIQRVKAK